MSFKNTITRWMKSEPNCPPYNEVCNSLTLKSTRSLDEKLQNLILSFNLITILANIVRNTWLIIDDRDETKDLLWQIPMRAAHVAELIYYALVMIFVCIYYKAPVKQRSWTYCAIMILFQLNQLSISFLFDFQESSLILPLKIMGIMVINVGCIITVKR